MSSRKDRISGVVLARLQSRLSGTNKQNFPALGDLTQSDFATDLTPPSLTSRGAIADLTNECLKLSNNELESKVVGLLEADLSVECIHEQILGSIAVELGERWLRDEISFVDVHLGVLQLESIAQTVRLTVPSNDTGSLVRAAFAATPGDQHTFGVSMATQLLNRRSWDVANLSGLSLNEWFEAVKNGSFDVVGLSLYIDSHFSVLCEAITRLKSDPVTASTIVLVTGDFFARSPNAAIESGADAYLSTIEETHRFVHAHLARLPKSGLLIESSTQV